MPTDPFVAPDLEDLPRQETNLAPGVHLPAAVGWRADRPGDLVAGQPTGDLLGRPGPNVGYAVTLANRLRDKVTLGAARVDGRRPGGDLRGGDEAGGVVRTRADHGRRRDRARTCSATRVTSSPTFAEWRTAVLHGADHEYDVRRALVDAVPDAVLRMPPQVPALRRRIPRLACNSRCTMVRVRFSPAPTGSLHIGSARTALFNWLYARHHQSSEGGGVFVLRIEDTDVARSRDEWVVGIQDTLRWLGLDWDEGPILQSSRFEIYRAAADRLLAQGDAYECYCTEDEVKERNDAAIAAGRAPGYDGHCRALTPDERVARAAEGRPRTIRFRTPDDGVSTFHRSDPRRGPGRVVAHPRLRDPAVRRHADLLPCERGRRSRDGDHAGDPRRGPHRFDASGPRAASGAGRDRRAPVRAPSTHRRRRVPGQAVEAPRRSGARGLPRRRVPARGVDELHRAVRVGRRPTTATRS